jgi:hypothetical protein
MTMEEQMVARENMTDDEKRIAAIKGRAIRRKGKVTLTEEDFTSLLDSRLAWKFVAKCFLTRANVQESPRWIRDEKTGQFYERQSDGVYAPLSA